MEGDILMSSTPEYDWPACVPLGVFDEANRMLNILSEYLLFLEDE